MASLPQFTVQRETQLDGAHLDGAYYDMLYEQLKEIFKFFPDGSRANLLKLYGPELGALLQVVVWWLTIFQDAAGPGLKFMGLKYRNEWGVRDTAPSRGDSPLRPWQKIGYLVFGVGIRWGWAKVKQMLEAVRPALQQRRRAIAYMPQQQQADALERLAQREGTTQMQLLNGCEKAEKVFRTLSLVNFLVFLYDGKYCSLLDRLLGARLVYQDRHAPRSIPFDFMNQQLVFDELTGFVKFMVPYAQALAKTRVASWVLGSKKAVKGSSSGGETEGHACTVCGAAEPVMPHMGRCGHAGCYVCLMSGIAAEPGRFSCPRCSTPMGKLRPVQIESQQ